MPLSEVASYVQRGKSPKYIAASPIAIVNQKCIRWHGVDPTYLKHLDPAEGGAWGDERTLQVGDILWNSTGVGTIGRAAVYKGLPGYERVVADSHVTIVRLAGVLPEFVCYFIQSPLVQSLIDTLQSGSTGQVELARGQVQSLLVPIPPIGEQHRIVAKIEELLTDLDAGVAMLHQAKRLVAQYRLSVLKAAVEGDLSHAWRDANRDGSEHAGDAVGMGLPEGWTWRQVKQLARVGTGATPLRSDKRYYEGGTIPWVTSGSLNSLFVDGADKMVTETALQETNVKVFPPGTLLVAMYGEGKTRGKVSELTIAAGTNQACAALVFSEGGGTC
ncbi:MAG TPA: restriction endonuclease subunit S [Oscillatoriaceae cyanobacterium]